MESRGLRPTVGGGRRGDVEGWKPMETTECRNDQMDELSTRMGGAVGMEQWKPRKHDEDGEEQQVG